MRSKPRRVRICPGSPFTPGCAACLWGDGGRHVFTRAPRKQKAKKRACGRGKGPCRVTIREGWHEAGRHGVALAPPVFVEQWWTPVKWDDEDDPTFAKTGCLVLEDRSMAREWKVRTCQADSNALPRGPR